MSYGSLLHSRRRELHLLAADLYGDAQIERRGEHLLRAGDERAAVLFLQAARREFAAHRPDAAAAFCRRGLTSAADLRVRAELLVQLGEALRETGRCADAEAQFEQASALPLEGELADEALVAFARLCRMTSDHGRAEAMLQAAQAGIENRGDTGRIAGLFSLRSSIAFAQPHVSDSLHWSRRAVATAEVSDNVPALAQALSGLGDACYGAGQIGEAATHFERAVQLAKNDPLRAIPASAMHGVCLLYELKVCDALTCTAAALEAAKLSGYAMPQIVAYVMRGFVLGIAGEYNAARQVTASGLEIALSVGAGRFQVVLLRNLGELLVAQGDRRAAGEAAREAIEIERSIGFDFAGPGVMGLLALATDDNAERLPALNEGESLKTGPRRAGAFAYQLRSARDRRLPARW